MSRQFGQTNLVRWQSRRLRRSRAAGFATAACFVAGLVGAALITSQAFGGLHLTGLTAVLPFALLGLAASLPIIAAAKAAVAWMAG